MKSMFSTDIIDSDAFLMLPVSSQALYFHLGMRVDDDGFVDNPNSIVRLCGCDCSDLQSLIDKRFILRFASGVCVIKHHWIHNNRRKDRHQPTKYQDELALLEIKENRAYTEKTSSLPAWVPSGCQSGNQWLPSGCHNRTEEEMLSTYKVVPVVGLVDDLEHSVVEPPARRSLKERAVKFLGGGKDASASA